MRRTLLFLLPVLLLCASVAVAGGPKKVIRPADQARARAMLVRKADVSGSHVERNSLGPAANLRCPALDESDLTVTGDARSPGLAAGLVFFASQAQVYESVADAGTSWRRAVSAAGLTCLRNELRSEFESNGLKLVSLRRSPFPRLAQRTVLYRVVLSGPTAGGRVTFVFDVLGLLYSRAQASIAIGSAVRPESHAEEVRLARLVAGRMAKAMQGA